MSPLLTSDDRRIAALAIPALGALAAEPLYVLVDTAIVGHLGTRPLAALALAGALLSAVTTLCNFLEYGGAPKVGRLFAVGDARAAAHLGRQSVLLGLALGAALALLVIAGAEPLLHVLGARGRVQTLAIRYLRITAIGLPFALATVAAQGYFRGVAKLRMPLLVLACGNIVNAALEVWFVYGLHLGIAGSAAGTVIAQAGMAAGFLFAFRRSEAGGLRATGPDDPYGPDGAWAGWPRVDWPLLRSLAATGGEIFVRTAALYASFLIAGAILARIGTASLAAHQIAFQLWNFFALVLDAVAIAAQVLVSHALAVGDVRRARAQAGRTLVWSLVVGVVLCAGLLAVSGVLPRAFTTNPRVLERAHAVWVVFALMQPVNGLAFGLDGVLIGAGDTRFLMWAMLPCTLLVFVPLAVLALLLHWGIVGVWLAIFAFVSARAVLTGVRFVGVRWTVRGLPPSG